MHSTESDILQIMKRVQGKEISTSELVKKVFTDEITNLEEQISKDFKDKDEIRRLKNIKAKLHRNILYHLNKLVDDDLIVVFKQGNKGEKFFKLNIEEGEEIIIEKKHRRIIISKPSMPAMPIDGYEKQGIIYKFEPETWTSRLNALLLQSPKFLTIKKLQDAMYDLFADFNDCIGLNDFEKVIQSSSHDELRDFLYEMVNMCEDYGKKITVIINLNNILNENPIIDFIKDFTLLKREEITIIFDTTINKFQKNKDFFQKIISIYTKSGLTLYIKNKSLHRPPYMLGRAGPYTFTVSDFDNFIKKPRGVCLPIASTSITVDVKKFFELKFNIVQFRKMISNILKTLFIVSSAQRTKSDEFAKSILKLNMPYSMELFKSSRNYIRFWNYGWKEEGLDQNLVVDLIKSTKNEVDEFCLSEVGIFKACGMPTDFKMAFSCAFSSFDENLSVKEYKRLHINSSDDLYKKEYKNYLKAKEELAEIFDGGDRIRFVRSSDSSSEEVLREIDLILNVYKIPFFGFNFKQEKSINKKLTSFFEK